jgi:hypothetical protein
MLLGKKCKRDFSVKRLLLNTNYWPALIPCLLKKARAAAKKALQEVEVV